MHRPASPQPVAPLRFWITARGEFFVHFSYANVPCGPDERDRTMPAVVTTKVPGKIDRGRFFPMPVRKITNCVSGWWPTQYQWSLGGFRFVMAVGVEHGGLMCPACSERCAAMQVAQQPVVKPCSTRGCLPRHLFVPVRPRSSPRALAGTPS